MVSFNSDQISKAKKGERHDRIKKKKENENQSIYHVD